MRIVSLVSRVYNVQRFVDVGRFVLIGMKKHPPGRKKIILKELMAQKKRTATP